jgi:hypothetical protein
MPSPTEIEVMRLLSAIDARPEDVAATIMAGGSPSVTVVCEAALGSYPGIRTKIRTNAASLLGWLQHPQAAETASLLVLDDDPDVAIRALRAVRRQGNEGAIDHAVLLLQRPGTSPVVAAEVVKALSGFETNRAKTALARYRDASPADLPHRDAAVVRAALEAT